MSSHTEQEHLNSVSGPRFFKAVNENDEKITDLFTFTYFIDIGPGEKAVRGGRERGRRGRGGERGGDETRRDEKRKREKD